MKKLAWAFIVVTLSLTVVTVAPAAQKTLRVLVTNDDGIGAPGLSTLVTALAANPNLEVTVIAPAANQSGTGDTLTTSGTFAVAAGMTSAGFAGTTVSGFPADSVVFGLRQALPEPPDVVVSGINAGQNITREIGTELSGTVGAALTAARLGVPAIAVSQGLSGSIDYTDAAAYTANVVEDMRKKGRLAKKLTSKNGLGRRLILNINFPTCSAGSVRGVKVVPLAELTTVTGYTLESDDGATQTYAPVSQVGDYLGSDCTSSLGSPTTDLEAMNNGFAAVTPLNPDLTVDSKLKSFRFLEKIGF